jgi:hypothetical protein
MMVNLPQRTKSLFNVFTAATSPETPDALIDAAIDAAIHGVINGVPDTKAAKSTTGGNNVQ